MKRYALWMSASVLALAWSGVAAAQPASPPPDASTDKPAEASDDGVEKVVVTSERRRTSLQRTPIAVTVITGEELENKGVTNVDSLQFVSPGATVNNFGQGIDFNIRGIGKSEHNTQTTTGVITYRDGVAGFPGYFTAEPYYDIARVEILRGPQGTFVGQNATGGAVFVTSNSPVIDGEYHGYLAGQIGNFNDFAVQGATNVPINDELAARIAFNGEMRDSFYDLSGPYTGDDGVKMLSGRIGLLWQPTSQFSALFKTDYNYLDFSAYPSVEVLARRGSTATGVAPILANRDLFEFPLNADMYARDKFGRSSLKLEYGFEDGTTIRAITGYQWGNSGYRTDLDGRTTSIYGEPTNWTFRDSVDEFIWSQEVNVISADDAALRWILGAYVQDDLHDFLPGEFVTGVPAGSIFTEYRLEGTNKVQNRAVFGQAGFNLFDDLELQVGARYSDSWTKNEGSISQYGLPLTMRQSEKYSAMSGKVSLNWIVDETNFLYAFAATGFKPGGLNLDVGLGAPAPFKSEKVTNYEVGWKAGWFDNHLRTQLDAYYNDYENFQVIIGYPQYPTFGFELNVPDTTKIYGFEAQAEAVFGNFSADLGLGWMHSELGAFWAVDPRNAPPAAVANISQCDVRLGPISSFPAIDPTWGAFMAPYCRYLGGKDQTYAPEFTFNLGAQYVFELGDGQTLTPRINFGHVSKQWATLFEDASRGDRIEDRNIINAQLAWSTGEWTATLYSTNLTNQHYAAALNSNMYFAGPPRQFGIRLMKVF
jgi:iron complex outermembrane receptor protein